MKKILIFILSTVFIYSGFAQQKHWIFFIDKPNAAQFLMQPEQILSKNALQRRAAQNIAISEKDVPVESQYLEVIRQQKVTVLGTSKWMNACVVLANKMQLAAIEKLNFVLKTQPVKTLGKSSEATDLTALKLYAQKNVPPYAYGQSGNQIQMLRGDYLHDENNRGQGMKIAVLDGGFTGANVLSPFDSLWAQNGVIGTKDFVDGDADVFHQGYHGMNVLSVMAGNVPNRLIGSAPKAQYFLLKSENQASETLIEEHNWVAAMEYADSAGAHIINSSLGYSTFDGGVGNYTQTDLNGRTAITSKAAAQAARNGILVVNSAGNEGNSSWQTIIAPADADSILAVGGVDVAREYVSFSSTGPSADGRIKPDVAAMAEGVSLSSSFGSVVTGNGTSFAAPLIAGLSACLWQRHPNATAFQIREAILQSAHQYFSPDSLLGYGIPDFYLADFFLNQMVKTPEPNEEFLLMPNPFDDELKVYFRSDTFPVKAYFSVSDAQGRLVLSKNILIESRIFPIGDFASLSAGVYFFTIQVGSKTHFFKMVKI